MVRHIIRPIQERDLDAYEEFAKKSSLGLINLPKNRAVLNRKITASKKAFESFIQKPSFEYYIFVLEDTISGELGGTCAISSRMGVTEPHYYFRLQTARNDLNGDMQILTPVCYPIGPTEICALYLKAEFRREGLGKLLSLCRFLFMANFRQRFEDYVVAEMRGCIQENDRVPFWESVCRKFLDVSYAKLCEMELESRRFMAHILPKWPIYIKLLPQEAQDCIAKTHDKTVPALKMLVNEGFTFTKEIDPFDGGPKIGCKTDDIATIKNSETASVDSIDPTINDDRSYLVCNTCLDFRTCFGKVNILQTGKVSISSQMAQVLKVRLGDTIRFVKMPPKETATPA